MISGFYKTEKYNVEFVETVAELETHGLYHKKPLSDLNITDNNGNKLNYFTLGYDKYIELLKEIQNNIIIDMDLSPTKRIGKFKFNLVQNSIFNDSSYHICLTSNDYYTNKDKDKEYGIEVIFTYFSIVFSEYYEMRECGSKIISIGETHYCYNVNFKFGDKDCYERDIISEELKNILKNNDIFNPKSLNGKSFSFSIFDNGEIYTYDLNFETESFNYSLNCIDNISRIKFILIEWLDDPEYSGDYELNV